MKQVHQLIQNWKNDLLLPKQNDVLNTIIESKNAVLVPEIHSTHLDAFTLPESPALKKIFTEHQKSCKETGAPIFGMVFKALVFQYENNDYRMPFLLASATIDQNRFSHAFHIHKSEDVYVNPLLLQLLKVEAVPQDEDEAINFIHQLGLSVRLEKNCWLANFHPHRFVLQKEWDALSSLEKFNPSLLSFFGHATPEKSILFGSSQLFPSDASQINAFNAVEHENIVLQGPPGTGKSHVISNMIGKNLEVSQQTLVVAEKAVALQVIYDKLKSRGLHHFCSLYHHELFAKNFVKSLQRTWHYLEELQEEEIPKNEISPLVVSGLDLTLQRLRQPDLIGGVSFEQFFQRYEINNKGEYAATKPTLPIWEKDKAVLEALNSKMFPVFGAWLFVKHTPFDFANNAQFANHALSILKEFGLTSSTTKEITERDRMSYLVSLFYADNRPLPTRVLQIGTAENKRFKKYYNRLKTLFEQVALLKNEVKHWKNDFSLTELEEYILIQSTAKKYSLNAWRKRQKMKRSSDLSFLKDTDGVKRLIEYKKTNIEITLLKEKVRKLGVEDDIHTMETIHYVLQKLETADNNKIKELFAMTPSERFQLKSEGLKLQKLTRQLSTYFELADNVVVGKRLEYYLAEYPKMIENSKLLSQLSAPTKNVLRKTASLDEAENMVVYSHFLDFKGQFPELAKFNGDTLIEKLRQIIQLEEEEASDFSKRLTQTIKKQFDAYHVLLQTPARKLDDEKKLLKQRLRNGKSILVKAFNKKRVFPSVLELLSSDARYWVRLLHPVFLCSPYSVAKSVPIDYTFDLTIFDEASQLPLSHVAGAIQRAERVVIAGDQQQMGPQFYFQKKGNQQPDALSHAAYYWKNISLSHHYRSQHPSLIGYSNRYFYQNRLITFPVYAAKPPIELVTLEGVYEERTNAVEAKYVAELIVEKLKKKEYNFGLVAFNQAQLQSILDLIPQQLQKKIEGATGIFVQSLENVQGDQCEHLIISMGYGKNPEGQFHKRFGPLNQEQGYRRLNVLMSRAISTITFVRSVTSKDFRISDNEGVEMLRKLMVYLETANNNTTYQWPDGIAQENDRLIVASFTKAFENGRQWVDFYRTFHKRGWKIIYESEPFDCGSTEENQESMKKH